MTYFHKDKLHFDKGEGIEQGVIIPTDTCSPEDRVAFMEEHAETLSRVYGMSATEIQQHLYFAKDLES